MHDGISQSMKSHYVWQCDAKLLGDGVDGAGLDFIVSDSSLFAGCTNSTINFIGYGSIGTFVQKSN